MFTTMTPRQFAANLHRLGVPVPDDLAALLATLDAINATSNAQPTADLAEQVAAGTITAGNVGEVIERVAYALAAKQYVHQVARELESPIARAAGRVMREQAEPIIKALRPTWDKAAAGVMAAGQHFPPGATAEQVLAGGTSSAAAWESLAANLNTLTQIRSVRCDLAGAGYGPSQQDATWWIASAPDADALARANGLMHGPGETFHKLAHAGFTLRLNTAGEAQRVEKGAHAATAQAQAEAEATALAKHREEHAAELAAYEQAARGRAA